MSKFGRKIKQPPVGFEYVEPTLTALDNELRESKPFSAKRASSTVVVHFISNEAHVIHIRRSGECPT